MNTLEELNFDKIVELKHKYKGKIDKICAYCSSEDCVPYYSLSDSGFFMWTLCDSCYERVYFSNTECFRKMSDKERFMFSMDEI